MPEEIKKPQISLNDTRAVSCPCGHEIFLEGVKLRNVSVLLTGTGKDETLTIPTIYCQKCGVELTKENAVIKE
jgi:hypothetical protein